MQGFNKLLLVMVSYVGVAIAACDHDNCLRALLASSAAEAPFCSTYLTASTTLPSWASACSSLPSLVSSACSCIATTATSASTGSSSGPPTISQTTTSSSSFSSSTASSTTVSTSPPGNTTTPVGALPSSYDVVWTTQSNNSAGSMPVGGGDIGLNAWVENGTILFYIAKSGTFDENNSMLKLGRIRLTMDPNPFSATASTFEQRLIINDGYIIFTGSLNTTVNLWVDVFNPVIHVEIQSSSDITLTAAYETWRTVDRSMASGEQAQSSWGVSPSSQAKYPLPDPIQYADNTSFYNGGVLNYHRNYLSPLWDFQTAQQNLTAFADTLYNPMTNNTFGLFMQSSDLSPSNTTSGFYVNTPFKAYNLVSTTAKNSYNISIVLAQNQTSTLADWQNILDSTVSSAASNSQNASIAWWHSYWQRSQIIINENAGATDPGFMVGKNYQLWRYMMGCNAYGAWPTKFNGGMFTFDPVFVNGAMPFTADYRKWAGGTFTAQNQRLLYWPLLKSGDFDVMRAQFDFYRRITTTSVIRANYYFGVNASFFTEQIDNTGLSNLYEYDGNLYRNIATARPRGFPTGMDFGSYQTWIQDTANEFADMILQANIYSGFDVTPYLPFIENQLRWFDLFYQQELLTVDVWPETGTNGNQKLIIYPGSGAETYKDAYNSASTVSGIRKVITDLLAVAPTYQVGSTSYYTSYFSRVPATPLRLQQGYQCISPAVAYARIQNSEITQLYPVFPWGEFGLGQPNLSYATNTWLYDTETQSFHSDIGWKQDQIWEARMGMTAGATANTESRFADSTVFRFPAFKGPNFDWAPDMNHYGSGAIGLQEQLIQTFVNRTIRLLPATPTTWSGSFKFHAPYNTTVEADFVNGTVVNLTVTPASRLADVIYGQA